MALQFSVAVRNARLDTIESTISTSAVLRILSGSAPANCATADSGTVLVEMSLPSDYLAAASSGAKSMSGAWEDTSANGTGTAGYFRIYASNGTTCHIQGTVGASGSGADMILDNTSIATAQSVTITSFTLNESGS